jgi:hypothetical protein
MSDNEILAAERNRARADGGARSICHPKGEKSYTILPLAGDPHFCSFPVAAVSATSDG